MAWSVDAQFPACRMVFALDIPFTFHVCPVCTCSLSHSLSLVRVVMVICVMWDFSLHVPFFFPVALDLYSWMIPLMEGFPGPKSISTYCPSPKPVFSGRDMIASFSNGSLHMAIPAPFMIFSFWLDNFICVSSFTHALLSV